MKRNIILGIMFFIFAVGLIIIPTSYSWTGQENKELELDLLQIDYADGMSTISGTIKNMIDEEIDISSFTLLLFNKEDIVFEKDIYIGSVIRRNETKSFKIQVTEDYSSITDASYKLVD